MTMDGKWLGHVLDRAAEIAADSTALIVGAERRCMSYAELAELVVDHSQTLQNFALRPGDVVGLQCANNLEFVVGLLGAARAGLVVAPFDPALPAADRRARAQMAGVRITFVDAGQPALDGDPAWLLTCDGAGGATSRTGSAAADTPRDIDAPIPGLSDRDALIMFTSGTTGTPKMVPWTHDNIGASVTGIIDAYGFSPSDATVAVMPLFHGHGLIAGLLATLASGGQVSLPARGRFSGSTFWDDADTVQATWYTAVPTIHQILLDRADGHQAQRSSKRLRFLRSCSAPLPPATAHRMEDTFHAPVVIAYGMTEATHQASTALPSYDRTVRLTTVGTPTGLSARIVDDNGNTCVEGATGEIWLSGPTIVRGYLNNPAATAATFVDGWLRTGDLGVLDRDGILSVRGRIKQQINRGGEKISPERVEDVLMSHPEVTQAVVFGIPDSLYGERVAAVVVTRNRTQPDLSAYSRGQLANFEIPERITFTDELPLTPKGSVDRSKAAQQFA